MILDRYGRALDLLPTVASRETAGEDFLNWTGVLPDPDPVLRKKADGARIMEDLAADDQVSMAMMARKNRVLNKRDYKFSPGEISGQAVDPRAKLLCERLTQDLENLKMFNVISGIMDAPFYGFAALETTWEAEAGWWRIKDLALKPNRWFGFDRDNRLTFMGRGRLEGRPVPEGKFVLVQHFDTYDNPYGLRLLARCLWPVAFKKGGITFYTRFVEKYGNPWTVITAPQGAKEDEMDRMVNDAGRMVRDGAMVVPYGAEVKLLESSGGAATVHEAYIRRWDAAISKVLMGQTMTAEVGEMGAYAASKTQEGTADVFAEADQHMVGAAMNELAWTYTQINLGPAVLAPVFAYSEAEDLAAKADLGGKLHRIGVRFKPKHFSENYGLAEDEFEVVSAASPADEAGGPLQFAAGAGGDFDVIEEAVRKHLPKALAAEEKFCRQVWNIVEGSADYEGLQRGLAALLGPAAEPDELDDLLGDLMVNANLFGRWAEAKKREPGRTRSQCRGTAMPVQPLRPGQFDGRNS